MELEGGGGGAVKNTSEAPWYEHTHCLCDARWWRSLVYWCNKLPYRFNYANFHVCAQEWQYVTPIFNGFTAPGFILIAKGHETMDKVMAPQTSHGQSACVCTLGHFVGIEHCLKALWRLLMRRVHLRGPVACSLISPVFPMWIWLSGDRGLAAPQAAIHCSRHYQPELIVHYLLLSKLYPSLSPSRSLLFSLSLAIQAVTTGFTHSICCTHCLFYFLPTLAASYQCCSQVPATEFK